MEDEYKNISPLYMQRLKSQVEDTLWNLFPKSKYIQVKEYIQRWHEYGEVVCNYWENFCIFEEDGHIDLGHTLAEMPNDILIKIAADIGVETPGILPCIPVMKNVLNQNNTNAHANFTRAVKDVYDHPDQSVALAASTLEGLLKTILQDANPSIKIKNDSLDDLTNKAVKELIETLDSSTPQEIKTLASQIRGLGGTINNLRSDKSTAHGKTSEDYVIDDALWAETIVNTTATLGLLLWRLYERFCSMKEVSTTVQLTPLYNDEVPF